MCQTDKEKDITFEQSPCPIQKYLAEVVTSVRCNYQGGFIMTLNLFSEKIYLFTKGLNDFPRVAFTRMKLAFNELKSIWKIRISPFQSCVNHLCRNIVKNAAGLWETPTGQFQSDSL